MASASSIGKKISDWWKGSKSLVIAICTIGYDLERRLQELSAKVSIRQR